LRFLLIVPLVLVLGVSLVLGQDAVPLGYEADGRKSGYLYMSAETQALQDDDFINPGMFAVETGRTLWTTVEGSEGKSCASCHEDAETTMAGVAARYPVYDETAKGLMNLELRINQMRTEHMGASAYPYESPELIALTAYVAYQSRGLPIDVAVDGPAAPFFETGRDFYFTRRGQLNLSCSQCHDERAGQRLRGDVISEGHTNGYPIYRLLWRAVASRHRMFEWCNTSIRAEPYPLGSPEYLSLELYVAWRGRGLAVETPAVRR
jgi:sulfur-oxidizing protein SoxA